MGHMRVTLCHDLFHPMKMVIRRLWMHYNLKLNWFDCYEQSDRSKKILTYIYHIIKYSWHKVTCMWPVMWFLQISNSSTCKGEQVRNVIIMRLVLTCNQNMNKMRCFLFDWLIDCCSLSSQPYFRSWGEHPYKWWILYI